MRAALSRFEKSVQQELPEFVNFFVVNLLKVSLEYLLTWHSVMK